MKISLPLIFACLLSIPPAFAVPLGSEIFIADHSEMVQADSPAYVIDVHGNVHDVKAEKEDSTIRKQRSLEERLDKLQAINEYYGKVLADMQKAVEKLTRVVLTLVQILETPLTKK